MHTINDEDKLNMISISFNKFSFFIKPSFQNGWVRIPGASGNTRQTWCNDVRILLIGQDTRPYLGRWI